MKAVLTSAPKATEVASAHKAIAVFDGVRGEGEGLAASKLENAVAKFKIARYLRYAHLIPAIACGLVKEFSIPVQNKYLGHNRAVSRRAPPPRR